MVESAEIQKSAYVQALEASLRTGAERNFIARFTDTSLDYKRKYFEQHLGALYHNLKKTNLSYAHQHESIESTRNFFLKSDNPARVLTVVPTGGGKTRVFTNITDSQAEDLSTEEPQSRKITPPTIILVPTQNLLWQTAGKLRREFPALAPSIGEYYDENKDIQPLTVMTYDSFIKSVETKDIRPGDISLLILDEAHRGLSDKRWKIFEQFKDNTVMLGYTASPAFDYEKDAGQLFGPDNKAYSTTVRRLVKDKIIPPIDNYVLHVDVQINPDAMPDNAEDLRKVLRQARLRAATEFLLTHEDPETGHRLLGHSTVVFNRFVNSKHDLTTAPRTAEFLNKEIRKRAKEDPSIHALVKPFLGKGKYIAEYVSGDDKQEAKAVLGDGEDPASGRIGRGDTMIVCNAKYLREGFDAPPISNVLNVHGSTSLVEALQGAGRCFRKWSDNPEKRCCVVDEYVTVNGQPSPVEDRPYFFFMALNHESILDEKEEKYEPKKIVSVSVNIETKDQMQELLNSEKEQEKDVGSKDDQSPEQDYKKQPQEYLGRDEFRQLVLGNGTAANKFRQGFEDLYDMLEKHAAWEVDHAHPTPFYVSGQPIAFQRVVEGKKVHALVPRSAVNAFRDEIGFPPLKILEYRDKDEFRIDVLGKGALAEEYGEAFDRFWERVETHYRKHAREPVIPPIEIEDRKIALKECVDERGDLMLTALKSAKNTVRHLLTVPRDKTPNWRDKDEFRRLVIGGAANPALYEEAFDALWEKMRKHHHLEEAHKEPFQLKGEKLHLADCMNQEGNRKFCVFTTKEVIVAARSAVVGDVHQWQNGPDPLSNAVSYSVRIDDLYRVLDDWYRVKNPPPRGWVTISELIKSKEYSVHDYDKFKQIFLKFRTSKVQALVDGGMGEEDAMTQVSKTWLGEYTNPATGRSQLYISPDAIKEMRDQGLLQLARPAAWYPETEIKKILKSMLRPQSRTKCNATYGRGALLWPEVTNSFPARKEISYTVCMQTV